MRRMRSPLLLVGLLVVLPSIGHAEDDQRFHGAWRVEQIRHQGTAPKDVGGDKRMEMEFRTTFDWVLKVQNGRQEALEIGRWGISKGQLVITQGRRIKYVEFEFIGERSLKLKDTDALMFLRKL